MLWHDRLGHPGSIMMHWIIDNSHGHPLKNQKILLPSDYSCSACSQGKLITKPSSSKIVVGCPSLYYFNSIESEAHIWKTVYFIFWVILYYNENSWNKYCNTPEVFRPKGFYTLTWFFWTSRINNNDALNYWKLSWTSLKEPKYSFTKWLSI